jgi:X-linked retinitis pigmentosa GTPase regulator
MKRTELKRIIREAVEEVMNDQFAPMGVANEQRKTLPPALRAHMFKKHGEKAVHEMERKLAEGDKRVLNVCEAWSESKNEMWTAWENKSLNEAEEGGEVDQNEEHDETDLSNPEEAKEVELANKIKALADELLNMHGAEGEEGEKEEGGEEAEEKGEEGSEEAEQLDEKWNKKGVVNPKKKGMFKGKTKAELETQLSNLKKKGPHKRGSKEDIKMKELNFAIRAKSGWPKGKK